MKKDFEVGISDIDLGFKEAKKPEDDKDQYLVIDEFDINFSKEKIWIVVKKSHIKEYSVDYCVDCLKSGNRNRDAPYGVRSKTEHWQRCKDHYAEQMRNEDPKNKCPKCDVGYLKMCGIENENLGCTHCDYRKYEELPFLHNLMLK